MSRSVTIPTYMQPDFVCTINNVTYRYKAGTTQEVPDEVAELIENIDAQEPVPVPPIPEGMWRADVPNGTYIASVNDGVAQYKNNDPYVIDLTSLETQPGVTINLTEEGIITYDEFIAATSSGRDIYVKANDGYHDWYWLVDSRRGDNKRIATTKGMLWSDDGITLAAVLIWGEEVSEDVFEVFGEMVIGFAANPYAGGGE